MKTKILVPKDQKIISIEELRNFGYSHYKINKLVEEGTLIKLNKKNYENTEYVGEDSDFYFVHAFVPTGVVCLLSAAVFYNLTTYRPESIDVAISKKKKVTTLPSWPSIKLYYFNPERYQTGIHTIKEGRNEFRIYDIEKTVIDVIFYRNKIGIEETKEILTNYLNRNNRDINKLYRYAEILNCKDVLRTYLEVLV
jgi:predicted transcriptional regulator of viral defense system